MGIEEKLPQRNFGHEHRPIGQSLYLPLKESFVLLRKAGSRRSLLFWHDFRNRKNIMARLPEGFYEEIVAAFVGEEPHYLKNGISSK